MWFRRFVHRGLRRTGYEVVRWPIANTLPWAIMRVFNTIDVGQVVDAGARHGDFVRTVRSVGGYGGPVMSFEPHPESFSVMEQRLRHDLQWIGHQVALGAKPGNLSLHVYDSSDFNSVLSPTAFGSQRFPVLGIGRSQSVRVERLDSFPLAEGAIFLKTDTQGYDLEVLNGATVVMDRIAVLLIELSTKAIYEGMPPAPQVMELIGGWGFQPVGFFPVSRDGLSVVEFDGLFVRA